jgi:hypothetical protein
MGETKGKIAIYNLPRTLQMVPPVVSMWLAEGITMYQLVAAKVENHITMYQLVAAKVENHITMYQLVAAKVENHIYIEL